MDHPLDDKKEPHDTNKDDDIENLDKGPIQETETEGSEKIPESVETDSGKTLEDQDINIQSSNEEKNHSTETVDIKIGSADSETENNQDTKIRSIEEENIQAIEAKTSEEMEKQTEIEKTQKIICMKNNDKYDSGNNKSVGDDRKNVTENICTADSTTDTNTIVIDLCDDDQIEIYEQTHSDNILTKETNLKSNIECDSSNGTLSKKMEDSNDNEEKNVKTTESNKETLDTVIIDLCDDDQIEMSEDMDGSTQADREGTLSQNEAANVSTAMPSNVVTEPKGSRGTPEPNQTIESVTCDDRESENETETCTTKEITKVELKIRDITDKDEPKEAYDLNNEEISDEACELTDKDKPEEACHMIGEDLPEATSKILLKCHPKGVDQDYSNADETASVNIDVKCNTSMITEKSDETENKVRNEEYEIENFRFKDDIITLQEDYGMDPKQISNVSSYDLEKSDMVPEEATFKILDESDSEEKQCDQQILGSVREDPIEKNAAVSEMSQSISKFEENEETLTKLNRGETESRGKIEHEPGLKSEDNEQEYIQLTLIKKEIEDDLKQFSGKGIEENAPKIEKDDNTSIQSETIHEQDQNEANIKVPSDSQSDKFPTKVMEDTFSENSNQQTAAADIKKEIKKEERFIETKNGAHVESCAKNLHLTINLDLVKSEENDCITTKPNSTRGCVAKEGELKFYPTGDTEDANKNLAIGYLNDTPPSLSDSESNEEFFDAVEYIPEGTAAKETSLIIKPSIALLSIPSLNLMNEPIPGPSGISTKKDGYKTPVIKPKEETEEYFQEATEFSSDEDNKHPDVEKSTPIEKSLLRDEALKTKDSRKHDDMEDDDENKKQKKIKLD